MLIARVWQDAGNEKPLHTGSVYQLPEPVACAFIATGAAERVEAPVHAARETRVLAGAPERKRGRR